MFLLGFYLTEDQRDNNDAEKLGGGSGGGGVIEKFGGGWKIWCGELKNKNTMRKVRKILSLDFKTKNNFY